MGFRYVILGAGRQGVALAYDLAANGQAEHVLLADVDAVAGDMAIERLRGLLPGTQAAFEFAPCDVTDAARVESVLRGADAAVAATPYRFNVGITDTAIRAGVSLCDLGGNTAVVREQLRRHEAAAAAGVSILPDCGLAPGLGNILAAHGISRLQNPQHVHVRCGGLPERPVGPLGYKLLFHFQGLINEYSGVAEFLRDGARVEVPTLTELEQIQFGEPLGMCEAAVTSGGTSTCPESFEGRLQTYDYKTVRYPGHFTVVRAMFELGCFAESATLSNGTTVRPKELMQRLMEDRLSFPDVADITVLRVTVRGNGSGGEQRELRYDLFDRHDAATGFSAMERTTAFPTALVAHMQARGQIAPGAMPLEQAIPLETYWSELPGHGIDVRLSD